MEEQEKKNKVRAEVKFPIILIHTPFGLKFFDKIANTRAARIYAKFNTYFMPIITVAAICLFAIGLIALFSSGTIRAAARDVGPQSNLLIPGLNPYLPWTYGWASLVVTIIIHEAGHGIVARVYKIKVESTGLVLLLGLPVGAFVNIEREELDKTPLKLKSAILTAGPLNNMIIAVVSLVALYFIVGTLSPLPNNGGPQYGVLVMGVNHGTLSDSIGLSKGSIIQTIKGQKVHTVEDLSKLLRSNLGKTINIVWKDTAGHKVTRAITLPHSAQANRGILGVTITDVSPDPASTLDRYKSWFTSSPILLLTPPTVQQALVPYSDLMATKYESYLLGPSFSIFANMLFWLWFINFNVGIFNALPIGPLDGGQLYNSLIETKLKSRTNRVKNATRLLTLVTVSIVVVSLFLPWLLR